MSIPPAHPLASRVRDWLARQPPTPAGTVRLTVEAWGDLERLAEAVVAADLGALRFEVGPSGQQALQLMPLPGAVPAPDDGGCRLCGARDVTPTVRSGDLQVGRCDACGVAMVMDPLPAVERYADDYSARYQRESVSTKADQCWALLKERTDGLRGVRRVLDLGCGEGAFLDRAKAAGLETAGVELAPAAALTAARAGHLVRCRSVMDGPSFPPGSFDVITLWDLLEHLPQPRPVLAQALKALAPGGRLFIATPMLGSIYDVLGVRLYRLSGGRFSSLVRMCWTRDHLLRFPPQGIRAVLTSMGFAHVDTRPLLLLSLRPERYAGGEILPSWTGHSRLDALLSRSGVAVARALSLHNKILIEARKERADGEH